MSPERWQAIDSAFEAARRPAAVGPGKFPGRPLRWRRCVAARGRDLLAAEQRLAESGDFLAAPLPCRRRRRPNPGRKSPAGDLGEELGRGGGGVVYRASRQDGPRRWRSRSASPACRRPRCGASAASRRSSPGWRIPGSPGSTRPAAPATAGLSWRWSCSTASRSTATATPGAFPRRAARAVPPALRGAPARAPEWHRAPRPQARQRAGHQRRAGQIARFRHRQGARLRRLPLPAPSKPVRRSTGDPGLRQPGAGRPPRRQPGERRLFAGHPAFRAAGRRQAAPLRGRGSPAARPAAGGLPAAAAGARRSVRTGRDDGAAAAALCRNRGAASLGELPPRCRAGSTSCWTGRSRSPRRAGRRRGGLRRRAAALPRAGILFAAG